MTHIKYSIHTERFGNLAELTQKAGFSSFNILKGEGYHNGLAEQSATIVIIADISYQEELKVKRLADTIRITNKQQLVLIDWHPINLGLNYA